MRTLVLGTPMVNGEGGQRALSASPSLTVTRRRPGSFREWQFLPRAEVVDLAESGIDYINIVVAVCKQFPIKKKHVRLYRP